jgi:hypothetical protein
VDLQDHLTIKHYELFLAAETAAEEDNLKDLARLSTHPNPVKEQRRQLIQKMLAEGKNFRQIGQILGIQANAVRQWAIKNNLYTPLSGQYAYGIPIGCRLRLIRPYMRGLCATCYQRFRERRRRNKLPSLDQLVILDHPNYKILYKAGQGYLIQTKFFDTLHYSKPTALEEILLDQLHRQHLIDLDETFLEQELEKALAQEEHDNPGSKNI